MTMTKKELVTRYIVFITGLFVCAVGVAITKHGELGVSPVSSVANILCIKFEFLSLGNWLIIWNCVLILGQIVILGRDFRIYQLLQVPLSFLFGWFTDIGMLMVSGIPTELYAVRIALVIVGTMVLGLGVHISVSANVIMNSGEAFVKAVSDRTGIEFGNVKIGFDVSCVLIAVALSLIFFRGQILGTREGTLIAAVFTGVVVKFCNRHLKIDIKSGEC